MNPADPGTGPVRTQARDNHLLAVLPDADWTRWRAHAQLVSLERGQVLQEEGVAATYVYFPTTAVVSMMYLMENGGSAEVAVLGMEGMVGTALVLGGSAMPGQAVVHSAGEACRVHVSFVQDEVNRGGAVLNVLLRYAQALMAQVAQTAVCNRYHSIDQQLCRRLLLGLDRLPGDSLDMTQELLSNLLGVRREGITAAALKLQMDGIIRYSRGHIEVLQRHRLEERSCECYGVARKEHRRLLPMPLAA